MRKTVTVQSYTKYSTTFSGINLGGCCLQIMMPAKRKPRRRRSQSSGSRRQDDVMSIETLRAEVEAILKAEGITVLCRP